MANGKKETRRLTDAERKHAQQVLEQTRNLLQDAASGDKALLWALRRYVYIRLQHDERGKPLQRKILKLKKMAAQKGKCFECGDELPERGAELDRLNAMDGYTEENTRLVCHACHRRMQEERKFT